MKSLVMIIALLCCVFTNTFAQASQAWGDATSFTSGAKTALHRVWGESMGYAHRDSTAHKADSIYRCGTYTNVHVRNSGVNSNGEIKRLPNGTFQVAYLGSTDATLLGGPAGKTANLYLKQGCRNLCWTIVDGNPNNTNPANNTNANKTGDGNDGNKSSDSDALSDCSKKDNGNANLNQPARKGPDRVIVTDPCGSVCPGTLAVSWGLRRHQESWVEDQCGNIHKTTKWQIVEYAGRWIPLDYVNDYNYEVVRWKYLEPVTKGWIKDECGRIYHINPDVPREGRQLAGQPDNHY